MSIGAVSTHTTLIIYMTHLLNHDNQSVPSKLSPLHYEWREENSGLTMIESLQINGVAIIDENPAGTF